MEDPINQNKRNRLTQIVQSCLAQKEVPPLPPPGNSHAGPAREGLRLHPELNPELPFKQDQQEGGGIKKIFFGIKKFWKGK